MSDSQPTTTTAIEYQANICEHHRDGTAPRVRPAHMLPPNWRIAECPVCGYWCEVNAEDGEVRAP